MPKATDGQGERGATYQLPGARVLAGWRARAMVESPSHLRDHPEPLTLTLLAALLHTRLREITDTLVGLLISTVYRLGARADRKVDRLRTVDCPLHVAASSGLDALIQCLEPFVWVKANPVTDALA